MDIRTTAIAAAGLAVWLGASALPAQAHDQGIITCQIDLGLFARDVDAAGSSLQPKARDTARKVIDVGINQCRSGPQLTMTNIRATRQAIGLPSNPANRPQIANYWSVPSQDMASLRE